MAYLFYILYAPSPSSSPNAKSNAKIEEARVRREALRAELHDYGAFSAEPDWEPLCLQVEAFVNGVKNEEFLRKAGELKHELVTLLQVSVERAGTGGLQEEEENHKRSLARSSETAALLKSGRGNISCSPGMCSAR